jgi:hypothetical protein
MDGSGMLMIILEVFEDSVTKVDYYMAAPMRTDILGYCMVLKLAVFITGESISMVAT